MHGRFNKEQGLINTDWTTGNPSLKYEHRRTSVLLHNIWNIRICRGKKTYCFCNLRKWKDFNKKQLTLLKMCVTSLLCSPWADLWPFFGCLGKWFSLYINVFSHTNLYISNVTRPMFAMLIFQVWATCDWTHKSTVCGPPIAVLTGRSNETQQ